MRLRRGYLHAMLIKLLISLIALSVPISFGAFAWGLVLLMDQLPLWAWVAVCFSHSISMLGLLALADSRR